MVIADTSFLISLYGDDVNSEAARQLIASVESISIHEVCDFEFANAQRLLVFRGKIGDETSRERLACYEADMKAGVLEFLSFGQSSLFAEAEAISARHTETLGNRAYDILQVAAAKLLGATDFWSFDGKQRQLAMAEGLSVGP